MVSLNLLLCRSLEGKKKKKQKTKLSIIDVHNISFCFNTLKLRNYVRAIDDIVVKQVETRDISVTVNPSLYAHVICIFNKVLWSENQVV
jgi:hypothetical protein